MVAGRRTAHDVVIAAATQHAVRAPGRIHPSTAVRRSARVGAMPVVLAPFPDVAAHVAQAKRVRKLASVRVLRDEEVIAELKPDGCKFEWEHEDAGAGLHFYRAEVREEGEVREFPHNIAQAAGFRAYSSPVWVEAG